MNIVHALRMVGPSRGLSSMGMVGKTFVRVLDVPRSKILHSPVLWSQETDKAIGHIGLVVGGGQMCGINNAGDMKAAQTTNLLFMHSGCAETYEDAWLSPVRLDDVPLPLRMRLSGVFEALKTVNEWWMYAESHKDEHAGNDVSG